MRSWIAASIAVWAAGPVVGQTPPGTDVFLVPLSIRHDRLTLGTPANLTQRVGYDNQPSFSPDGRVLYYTVVTEGGPNGTTQADIMRVTLATGRADRFTTTPESEYSATVMPSGREVAVIRVEADSTQRLWAFPVDGSGPRRLFERIKPVGYQTWLDQETVGMFVLGSPSALHLGNLATGDARVLLADIGRAIHRVPGRRAIAATHRVADGVWWIVEIDAESATRTPIVAMPPAAEYFIWLPDRTLLSASGSTLWRFRPGIDRMWQAAAEVPGVSGITRLAVSPNGKQLAFVAEDRR